MTCPPSGVKSTGSQFDPFGEQIAAMLAEDPKVAATVITEGLRRFGFAGSVPIVKDRCPAGAAPVPVLDRIASPKA